MQAIVNFSRLEAYIEQSVNVLRETSVFTQLISQHEFQYVLANVTEIKDKSTKANVDAFRL